MLSHAEDLRSEGMDAAQAMAVCSGWRTAGLAPREAALCAFTEKLTLTPALMAAADHIPLREVGLDDVAIHDLVQACAYFNYINRVADGLGVDLEPEMEPPTTGTRDSR